MKLLNIIINYGLYLFVFLLPWQTRWIYQDAKINGGIWEYGRLSLYGTEILLITILILGVIRWLWQYQRMTKEERVQEIKNELRGIRFWIILLIVWSAATILWSQDKLLGWYGWLKLVEGVGLFWLIANNSRMVREWRANSSPIDTDNPPMAHGFNKQNIINVLILSGVTQAIFGISQFMRQMPIMANKWLGLATIDPWQAGTSVIEFLDQRWLRAYGALSHPNILGGFLAICLLLVVIDPWHHETVNHFKKESWLNLFYWLSVLVIFFGLLLTFSRGAWLAFLVTFIGSFVYGLIKKAKNIIRINAIVIACFIGIIGLFLIIFPYQLITTRFHQDTRLEKMSIEQRVTSYHQAQSIIKSHFLTGVGLNNYTVVLQKNEPNQSAWYYQPVHDVGLLTWAELGIIGLLLFIMIIISAFRHRSQYWLALLVILLLGCFDHYFRSMYFGIMLWWLIIGVSLNLSIKNNAHYQ